MPTELEWHQVVEGVQVDSSWSISHALLQGRVALGLLDWVEDDRARGLAGLLLRVNVDARNSYVADVSWFSHRRHPRSSSSRRLPDICVEIRSPSTWRYDVGAKRDAYERGGLPELWLVDDRAQAMLVYRRSQPGAKRFDEVVELGHGDTLASPQLPGFALPLAELFRDR
jgi:Uma2 family endonuclease